MTAPAGKAATRRLFIWSAIVGLFLDQLSKLLVQGALMTGPPGTWRAVRLIGSALSISPTHNPDGLFSWHYGPQFVYFVLPLLGSALVIWFALRTRDRWSALAYGIILGGALGNLVDRARMGWVIDFIDCRLPWIGLRWFTFNLADSWVVVGIVILLAREFFGSRAKAEPEGAGGPSPAPPTEEIRPAIADKTDDETRLPRQ